MDLARLAAHFDQDATPMVRSDFSDDDAWQRVVLRVPGLVPVDDRSFEGATGDSLAEAAQASGTRGYVVLADARTMAEGASGGELTVAYVDISPYAFDDAELFDTFPGRTFRCVPEVVADIEANLSLANVDFGELADAADTDEVLRGFDGG